MKIYGLKYDYFKIYGLKYDYFINKHNLLPTLTL